MNQIDDIQLLPTKSRQTSKGNSVDSADTEDNSFEDVKSRSSRRKYLPKTGDVNKPR